MSKRLAFFGHVNIDVVLVTPDLHRQGSSEVTAVREEFGGTAGNFAIVASRIGVSFDLYGAISRSTHARYIEFLKSLGIDTFAGDQLTRRIMREYLESRSIEKVSQKLSIPAAAVEIIIDKFLQEIRS